MHFRYILQCVGITLLLIFSVSPPLASRVFHSPEQAKSLAFPDADRFAARILVLSPAQVGEVEKLSRTKLTSKVVRMQKAWRGEKLLGYFVIDVHNVRTKSEALLVVLDAQGRVSQVRVLAFHEPIDYKPVQRWYDAFAGKKIGDDLRVGYDVDAVSGATLTTRSTSAAVRRVLAYHKVFFGG